MLLILEFVGKEYCKLNLTQDDFIPTIKIDSEIMLSDINGRMINFLKYLDPYGPKNPKPKFISRELKVDGIPKVIGKDQTTVKFKVKQNKSVASMGTAPFVCACLNIFV